MNHFNKEEKNELIVIPSSVEEESIYEQVAEMVLSQSLFTFQKSKLMEQIDYTLVNRDEQLFMHLSSQYINLLSQYSYLN